MRKVVRLSTVVLLFATVTTGPALAGEYVLFYHNDTLGSPVAVTDINGNVVWRADYEPFGNLATLTETLPNTHDFIGKERDAETSLHYFGARFYDGGIGRFLSGDPILLRGRPDSALEIPQRMNMYVYATNNPYRFLDPDGFYTFPVRGGGRIEDSGRYWATRAGRTQEHIQRLKEAGLCSGCHLSVDIAAKIGVPVVAIARGTVLHTGTDDPKLGMWVEYETTDGLRVTYGHLSAIDENVKRGKVINEGEQIGKVGATGNADPNDPHLHVQIKEKGKLIDPLPIILNQSPENSGEETPTMNRGGTPR